ncbi:AAA family ATPase [Actinoplanes sp. M2I2]|uniref:AAA family ATPase n=1 Tax=Actinoplanes sp. M2I2 TaxID=1734444 RepID=UPI002020D798|nr:AAA family ATPase [Actinoplanes sp. M2I2]
MPRLVVVTGPIASGKNAVADHLVRRLTGPGHTVVVADVDDIAAMVMPAGAARRDLWFSAHGAHGALVGRWMRSPVDFVIAVGNIYSAEEQAALTEALPDGAAPLWVLLDAPVTVTLVRARDDPGRGLSRDPEFHRAAHRRFRALRPGIPADQTFDAQAMTADRIADAIRL